MPILWEEKDTFEEKENDNTFDSGTFAMGIGVGFFIIFISYLIWGSHLNNESIEKMRVERTILCKSLGGDEFHFRSDTCEKIIQERKTKEIKMPNIGQN